MWIHHTCIEQSTACHSRVRLKSCATGTSVSYLTAEQTLNPYLEAAEFGCLPTAVGRDQVCCASVHVALPFSAREPLVRDTPTLLAAVCCCVTQSMCRHAAHDHVRHITRQCACAHSDPTHCCAPLCRCVQACCSRPCLSHYPSSCVSSSQLWNRWT
jgi:hypothetical protein